MSFWAIFWPFSPLTTWKIKFWKLKNNTWRHYHFTHLHHQWQSYGVRFLRYVCHSGLLFPLLHPYGPRKSKILKNEKTPEDIIILQVCVINDSHMMYGSWDMECNRQIFLSFWNVFCPFTPQTTQKLKFKKNEKNTRRSHHFIYVYQKSWSDDVWLLRYGAQWADRQMDGQTDRWMEKWHIEVGAPPKNEETFGNGSRRRTRLPTSGKILSSESTHQLLPEHKDNFHSINFGYIAIWNIFSRNLKHLYYFELLAYFSFKDIL